MKPLALHIIMQKNNLNISTGIDFIGDHIQLEKYSKNWVYDMTQN